MANFLAFEASAELEPQKRTPHTSSPSLPNKRRREEIKQVPASSLLSSSTPWIEAAAHSFLPPHHPISEQRAAFWKHYVSLPPILQLHEEILAFERYISPTPSEVKARSDLFTRVNEVVQSLWPGSKVSPFGSFYTELYLPTSDIDIVVMNESGRSGLRKLASVLVKKKIVESHSIKVISRARIPIIKFTDNKSQITVDISFNQDSGVDGSEKLRSLLSRWPGIRPLVLILKQFLLNRGLNEVYSGGLGSYGLILLCISFFQMHPMIQAKLIKPEENLGVLLIEFFELYGKCLAYDRVGISVLGRGSYFPKSDRIAGFNSQSSLLMIEDPYDASNDVTKASFSISVVRQSFAYAYEILTTLVRERSLDPLARHTGETKKGKMPQLPPSLLSSIISVPKATIQHRFELERNFASEANSVY